MSDERARADEQKPRTPREQPSPDAATSDLAKPLTKDQEDAIRGGLGGAGPIEGQGIKLN